MPVEISEKRLGIYELRVRLRTTNCRMLYFFHGRVAAVLAHGLVKEGEVPQRLAALEQARANDQIARKLTALRIAHGLSQRQLAQLIGTTASVICRLEDANYEGHSLAMLNRIAAALNQRVEIRFVPAERRLRSA